MKINKTKKYMKPGSISSYLRAQQKQLQVESRNLRQQNRNQLQFSCVNKHDIQVEQEDEIEVQVEQEDEHEMQVEQEEVGIETQQDDQEHVDQEVQHGGNKNSTMEVDVTTQINNTSTIETGMSSRKKRGQTTMSGVHSRTEENRKPIFLNELNQPIGPDEKTLSEFSSFLGTLARNATLAPLTEVNWRVMPTKEALWEYVQKKYIVPLEAKKWVLSTIRDDWRVYKCRVKKNHYYKYKTDKERLLNRPKDIAEEKFKQLLKHWNSTNEKRITEINVNSRKCQKNLHTAGKISFARIRKRMQDANENKEPPTNSELFIETRKRKPDKIYKESYGDTCNKIAEMEAIQSQQISQGQSVDAFSMVMGGTRPGRVMLYGRGVTPTDLKGKGTNSESSVKIPEGFIEGVQEKVRQELTKEMDEKMEAYKFSMQQQFQSVISHFLDSIPGLNINQVPGLNLNFDPIKNAGSAPNQPMHGYNPNSSISNHEPQEH